MLNQDKVKLAIAPIAWTNDDLPDLGAENTFEQCVSEMALSGFKGSEIMEVNIKTCINRKAEMFASAEATITEPGNEGKSYKVRKDFDL